MKKGDSIYLADTAALSFDHRTWKEALLNDRLFLISLNLSGRDVTIGYRIVYYLWSADIWFGKLPFLKFIVAVNIAVWILQFVF